MNLFGEYKFIQHGKVLAAQKNLITTKGSMQVLRLLTSQSAKLGEALAVGIGSTAATVADSALTFETARAKVTVSSPDFVTGKITFKATLPNEFIGIIYEAGLWSTFNNAYSGNYDSRVLVGFDSASEYWPSTASWQTANARLGKDSLRIAPTVSTTKNLTLDGIYLDLLGYSDSDILRLAYWVQNSNCANVKLKLMTDASNYYTYTITSPTSGYHVDSFNKNNFAITGSPAWSAINSVDVSATASSGGAVNVDFDGLRIEDVDSFNPDYFLVSRSVLGSPLVKDTFAPMDIEYTLSVSVT